MTTVYAVGTLRKNKKGIFELTNVGIYSEDPWRMTRQQTGDICMVLLSIASFVYGRALGLLNKATLCTLARA